MAKEIIQQRYRLAYHPHIITGETNNEPSLTVPDQARDITEILTRFANGMPLGVDDTDGQFFGEDVTVTDVRKLDLIQRQELAREAQKRTHDIRRKLELADAERKERAWLARMQQAYDDRKRVESVDAEKKGGDHDKS